MSETARFVSMITPDLLEAGGRAFISAPEKKKRRPSTRIFKNSSFGTKEMTMTTTNPESENVQAGLNATLSKFVDAQTTPEKRAEVMIKIGQYQVELSKFAPMLKDADTETAGETLSEWFDEGDADLKKALVNVTSGSEEFPLTKAEIIEAGPEVDLAKMLDDAPLGQPRVAMLQKISFYAQQLREMVDRGEMLKVDPADLDTMVTNWIEGDDGSHRDMKKALANASTMARQRAAASVGENEAVGEKVGNAPTHVASKLGNPADRTYVPRPTGEGQGRRMAGAVGAPNQDDGGDSPAVSSGPNDGGEGGVSPTVRIRRKGTTGGLGSVAGAQPGTDQAMSSRDFSPQRDGSDKPKKKKKLMDKSADLSVELVKVAPDAMIAALSELSPEDQTQACQAAAQDAADLMAWSMKRDPDALEKSVLDAAITDWLQADPDTLQAKRWVAEALATAEEIPLSLGKAIMEWRSPAAAAVRLRARAAA